MAESCPDCSPIKPRKAVKALELFCWGKGVGSQRMVVAVLCSIVLHGGVAVFWRSLSVFQEGEEGGLASTLSMSLLTLHAPPGVVLSDEDEPALQELHVPSVKTSRKIPIQQAPVGSGEQFFTASRGKQVSVTPEAPVPFGTKYFRSSELTKRPRPLRSVSLSYPVMEDSANNQQNGSVTLRIFIADTGDVDQVVVEASDLSMAFQDYAVQTFSQVRFSPGKIHDLPVRSQMRLEVTFQADPLTD